MRKILILLLILLIALAAVAFVVYNKASSAGMNKDNKIELFIPSGTSKADLDLMLKPYLSDPTNYEFTSALLRFKKVKPGKYIFKRGINNLDLVRQLRAGLQTPVKVTFVKSRHMADLAGKLTRNLEADSAEFLALLQADSIRTRASVLHGYLPNTYEMWWTTSSEQLYQKMKDEYNNFWTEARQIKAKNAGLSKLEASVIASIVEEESNKNDERPTIAGVYLNRLKKGWGLEADPTLKYALGRWEIKRVTNPMKQVNSPYNTYMFAGVPPGSICTPSLSSLKAVLNAEEHQYMFFCANAEMNGYHSFARTLSQHNVNAARYHAALNRLNIH